MMMEICAESSDLMRTKNFQTKRWLSRNANVRPSIYKKYAEWYIVNNKLKGTALPEMKKNIWKAAGTQ